MRDAFGGFNRLLSLETQTLNPLDELRLRFFQKLGRRAPTILWIQGCVCGNISRQDIRYMIHIYIYICKSCMQPPSTTLCIYVYSKYIIYLVYIPSEWYVNILDERKNIRCRQALLRSTAGGTKQENVQIQLQKGSCGS